MKIWKGNGSGSGGRGVAAADEVSEVARANEKGDEVMDK
jgi:hypothetical protein